MNDIADNLESLTRLFADDTSLLFSSSNISEIEMRIKSDLEKLLSWSENWLTVFNPSKTKVLFVSNIDGGEDLHITFGTTQLKFSSSHRHLGVVFSSDGKWSQHIDSIYVSCMKKVNMLRKLKFIIDRKSLIRI